MDFLLYSSNLKLSSANSFSLEFAVWERVKVLDRIEFVCKSFQFGQGENLVCSIIKNKQNFLTRQIQSTCRWQGYGSSKDCFCRKHDGKRKKNVGQLGTFSDFPTKVFDTFLFQGH